ncbi:ATP-binding cassette domain-containing protein, partial [Thermophilibacter provencensis]
TLDGHELRDVEAGSLYDLVSLIDQSVFLFDDTIRANVTMFRDFPDEAVDDAVRRAGLAALVAEKGEGFRCGENGSALSGGERQRVSTARALLRRTPVLLVDEATAALDNQTARAVGEEILGLEGLTRVVVTHRLEAPLLERYDEVVALRDGRVVERGTFDELMAARGYFYSLFTVSN